jgi:hypothetical protein
MRDQLVLADSAGHTMIDIEAARALDQARRAEPEPKKEEKQQPAQN